MKTLIAALLLAMATTLTAQPMAAPAPAPAPTTPPTPTTPQTPATPRVAPTPAPAPTPRLEAVTQLFQVVVLHGSTTGPEATEGVPKNVERAIADVRDFLPFKRYRLIDSGILRLNSNNIGQMKLEGLNGSEYQVSFTLRSRTGGRLGIDTFRVQQVKDDTPVGKPFIATSFDMDREETVVVGSSRLGGGSDALVVLLTAMPGQTRMLPAPRAH